MNYMNVCTSMRYINYYKYKNMYLFKNHNIVMNSI